jgi:hypothetical protein
MSDRDAFVRTQRPPIHILIIRRRVQRRILLVHRSSSCGCSRIEDVRIRDERDLAPVDVLSGKVDAPNAPIPHWREYNTTSRRTSLIIDPPDGRLPARTSQARAIPVQRCGSLQRGEPCDSYEDYSLGVRCIVHGGGFPDAMFPAVYNANMRIVQSPGFVAISYELIHDTRIIALESPTAGRGGSSAFAEASADRRSSESGGWSDPPAIRTYMGRARGRWEGTTLVVESSHFKATTRGATPGLRLIERFTRTGADAIQYQVTFVDPATWTAPWTAALDLKGRPADSGVFEYACHEGNYGMANMLSASRHLERTAGENESRRPSQERR